MSNQTLENIQSTLQTVRKPIYDIIELLMVFINGLFILYVTLNIPILYQQLGMGFLVPLVMVYLVCSAPLRAVQKWRIASLLYQKKRSTELLERLDTDAPSRHLTLLGGAIWCVLTIGLFSGVLSFFTELTIGNFFLRFFAFAPLLFLGPIQVGYILVTNKIHHAILTKKTTPHG